MIKLLFLYFSGLGLAWLGLCSIMFAVANWASAGALMPLAVGLVILLAGTRIILATVRIYLPPKNRRSQGQVNFPQP